MNPRHYDRFVRRLVLLGAVMWAASSALRADDWPQFRGPTGQGHSNERGVPVDWSETHNVRWKTPVPGRGWSSPIVSDGKVWLTTAVADRGGVSLRALAFDVESGREVVNTEVFRIADAALVNAKDSHASAAPVAGGDRIYV